MNYVCNICKYKTTNKSNITKHNNTLKHKQNIKNINYCIDCNKTFDTLKQYIRHINYHKQKKSQNINDTNNGTNNGTNNETINNQIINTKNINIPDNNIIQKIDKINDTQNIIINENKELKDTINKALTKASSLINYLMKNHNTIPPLKTIEYNTFVKLLKNNFKEKQIIQNNNNDSDNENEQELFDLANMLINKFKKNKFISLLTQVILKYVNYKDPEKQPIYNTDNIRYNYVVKMNKKWNEDKTGIIFKNYIIIPIIYHLNSLLKKYRHNEFEKKMKQIAKKKNNIIDIEEIMNQFDILLRFEIYLNNEKFIKDILKEISPYLKYIEKEILDSEENNKLTNIRNNYIKEITILLNNINENNTDSEKDSELKEEKRVKPKKIIKQKNKLDSSSKESDNSSSEL